MPENTSASRDYSALYTPVAIIVAGVIIGVSVVVAFGGSGSGGGGTPTAKVDIEDVDLEGEPYIGEEDAPVVLAYWSDYQCPYCKAVEVGHEQIPIEPSLPALVRDYVNTGKIRIVFKDYAFLGPDSTTAARYEGAVWELYPDKFFAWRTAMFNAQDEEHGGFGDEASIVALTAKISGIDVNRVKALVAQKGAEYDAEAAADQKEGASFGVNGTPGFITGTTLIGGAETIDAFKAAIDPQL